MTENLGPKLFDQEWQGARLVVARNDVEPQTYFVTWTCYGTWLHGNQQGSVDREHNVWQTPPLEPDEERERREFELLKHAPVVLGVEQRIIAHQTIEEVCRHRGWRLHTINVRTNHVHVVVTANRTGKRVINDFKSYSTRKMKDEGHLPEACREVLDGDRSLTVAARGNGNASQSSSHATQASSRDREGAVPEPRPNEFKVWTRGGSARPINTENSFRRAIEYTLHEQGPEITFPYSVEP